MKKSAKLVLSVNKYGTKYGIWTFYVRRPKGWIEAGGAGWPFHITEEDGYKRSVAKNVMISIINELIENKYYVMEGNLKEFIKFVENYDDSEWID